MAKRSAPASKSAARPKSNADTAVIKLLNEQLAVSIDLALATKQAHWNLRGPQFIGIHEMLDGFRTALDVHVDTIAERVAQLDGIALGTTQAVAAASALKAYPQTITRIPDHLDALIERYGVAAKKAREGIDAADEAGDADSADILTAYSRDVEKSLWFLRSHIEH